MDKKVYYSNSVSSSRKSVKSIAKDKEKKLSPSLQGVASQVPIKTITKPHKTKMKDLPFEWISLCTGVCLGFALLLCAGGTIKSFAESDGIERIAGYVSERIKDDSRLDDYFNIDSKENKKEHPSDKTESNSTELPAFVLGQGLDAEEYVEKYNQIHYSYSGVTPVDGQVSSKYSFRKNPFFNVYPGEPEFEFHSGVDIAAEAGCDIRSYLDGTVVKAALSSDYGYYAIIDHGNGLKTLYAHASKLLCEEGDEVSKGDVIALVGSTGKATGPHLHFEVIKDGEKTDPSKYLKELF